METKRPSIKDAEFVRTLRAELKEQNCSPNFTEHVVAVEILLSQLKIADSWQWEELHEFLKETGAWPLMKEKLGHLGWMELLEDVFETSHTAQEACTKKIPCSSCAERGTCWWTNN